MTPNITIIRTDETGKIIRVQEIPADQKVLDEQQQAFDEAWEEQ